MLQRLIGESQRILPLGVSLLPVFHTSRKGFLTMNRFLVAFASLTLAVFPQLSARGSVLYTVQDLGTLGGSYSFGKSVNASGQVAGYS